MSAGKLALIVIGVLAVLFWIGSAQPRDPSTSAGSSSTSPGAPRATATAPAEPVLVQLTGEGKRASDVFQLQRGLVRVTMSHGGRRNFIVRFMHENGERVSTHGGLANEIGAFEGESAFRIEKAGGYLIDVDADGPWEVTFTQ